VRKTKTVDREGNREECCWDVVEKEEGAADNVGGEERDGEGERKRKHADFFELFSFFFIVYEFDKPTLN